MRSKERGVRREEYTCISLLNFSNSRKKLRTILLGIQYIYSFAAASDNKNYK